MTIAAYAGVCPTCHHDCAAAPAPSSLAGGEKLEAIARIVDPRAWKTRDGQYAEIERSTVVKDKDDARRNADSYIRKSLRLAEKIAALSPEAPSREGVEELIDQIRQTEGAAVTIMCDNPDFNGQPNSAVEVVADWTNWQTVRFTGETVVEALRNARNMVGGKIMGECGTLARVQMEQALTPRHEAPAGKAEYVDAIGALSERTPEAPAEGAGEAARIIACHLPIPEAPDTVYLPITMTAGDLRAIYAALRARSSAPEAREGEAVAWTSQAAVNAISFGSQATMWPARANTHPIALYTHPAAPSADKLLEGRDNFIVSEGLWEKFVSTLPTPDALKGDAK